ncbi:hypothetical protein CC1G_11650 [Coprinopsis cinerea okayama7|uniref:Uncharacterized protein n=1 Tax=Coprinopsis cinerea (strain Okayama-7 / 130 / ATCC MYA-4618 / FGSC 9003) TaxID=240176 RepID=A8P496_COPC7|nr:hypothetical protein CC1G_11650 [Coprinopsis cinerea okayama7\|eukprot:XP_001838707.1 hypothetical protein CC1G_11650 [Coprinopsis cinerea okayama7\
MTTTIQLKATLYWKLVFEYNNSDNSGQIVQSYTAKVYSESTRSTFSETVSRTTTDIMEKEGITSAADASWGPVSANVSASYEHSEEVNYMLEQTTKLTGEDVYKKETEETRSYTIGPGGKLNLYQQYLSGPGLNAAYNVFSTEPKRENERTEVIIDVVVEAVEFIRNIRVVYTDSPTEAPTDRIRELNGGNADVNADKKGNYVWLVPEYTRKYKDALTGLDFVQQDHKDDRYMDLAKGAGGSYRYLVPAYNTREKNKFTECTLLRSNHGISLSQVKNWGWSGMTLDINAGRGGDFLYVLWKTRYAY